MVSRDKKLTTSSGTTMASAWRSLETLNSLTQSTFESREIGAYLRKQRLSRSASLFPEIPKRRRQVDHLTQVELASLAGISKAAVSQIESSRYPNLNQTVLRKMCHTLGLDGNQEHYILSLLEPPCPANPEDLDLPAWVTVIVELADPLPAVIINPRFDILFWNHGATVMLEDFETLPSESRNVLKSMFCVPQMREMWVDWESYARALVSGLKMQSSQVPQYRTQNLALAEQMSKLDPQFARFWQEAEPFTQPAPEKDLIHPKVGLLRLYQAVTQVVGAPHLTVVQFSPRDEETAVALGRL